MIRPARNAKNYAILGSSHYRAAGKSPAAAKLQRAVSEMVGILACLSGHFAGCRPIRPDSQKRYAFLTHETVCRKTYGNFDTIKQPAGTAGTDATGASKYGGFSARLTPDEFLILVQVPAKAIPPPVSPSFCEGRVHVCLFVGGVHGKSVALGSSVTLIPSTGLPSRSVKRMEPCHWLLPFMTLNTRTFSPACRLTSATSS